eukprot:5804755-Alexandrium_andersonii.AAC.1
MLAAASAHRSQREGRFASIDLPERHARGWIDPRGVLQSSRSCTPKAGANITTLIHILVLLTSSTTE